MIITLLIHQYITQIQENTIKSRHKVSQQANNRWSCCLWLCKDPKYLHTHNAIIKKKEKTISHLELTSVRNEKKKEQWVKQNQQGSGGARKTSFGIYRGLASWEGPVDFQAGAFSYVLISNYVPVVRLMLCDTINGCLMVSLGQMRHSTLQTLNIYISSQRRRRTPLWTRQLREGRKKKSARHSL